MNVSERIAAEIERLGVEVDEATRQAWTAAAERVVEDLGTGIAPQASPGRLPAGAEASDSPFTWRAEPPLAPTAAGPLDGLRLAVKDLIAVTGRPLRAGSRARAAAPPEPDDAPVVAALRAAGALVVGTTKLHEFAFGVTGINAFEGTAANPAAPGRVPGGSSSGSAAVVAAGLADVALGSDTGGSCRIPAACCAVVGFKPTYGVVDVRGVLPLAPSLDHVGWLAADVATARRLAEVLGLLDGTVEPRLMPTPRDTGHHRRLGVHRRAVEQADPDVREGFETAAELLRATGWDLVDVTWPGADETFAVSTAVMFTEAAYVHRESLRNAAAHYGADVRARLVQGRGFGIDTYLRARERQAALRARCLAIFDEVLAVVGPTLAIVPPAIESATDPALAGRMVANTRLANLTGLPAMSVPVPGCPLPVGIHIEAPTDDVAFSVAAALEAALQQAA